MRILLSISMLIVSVVGSVIAGATEYFYQPISIDEGLSQSSVRSIIRDSQGFLWLGTRYGLNRYDFQSIETYYHNPTDSTTLPDNNINFIFEDKNHTIWISTEKGLASYDRRYNQFSRIVLGKKALNVRSYFNEKDGFFLGGAGELHFYSYDTRTFQSIPLEKGSRMFITFIGEWMPGKYVLSTRWDGIWLYDRMAGSVKRFESVTEKNIMSTHIDSKGNLWVAPYGDGLRGFNREGVMFYDSTQKSSRLSGEIILAMLNIGDELWIATDGGGINVLNLDTHAITQLNDEYHIQGAESVLCFYKDQYDNLFAGTVHEGAVCIQNVMMHTYSEPVDIEHGQAVTTILSADNRIYVGVDGNGIWKFNPDGSVFSRYLTTRRLKVTSIADYDASRLIVATFGKGFFLMDKHSGLLSQAPDIFRQIAERNRRKALAITLQQLRQGEVEVITDSIFRVNIENNTFRVSTSLSKNPSTQLIAFHIDKINREMLCIGGNSIVRYESASGKISPILSLKNNQIITCAQFDGIRNIYLATNNELMVYDLVSHQISPIETKMFRNIRSLLLDGSKLWVGAANTLFLHLLDHKSTIIFSKYDGVASNEFVNRAVLITDNELYMGGINGLLKINRADIDNIINYKSTISISLSGLEIDGASSFMNIDDGRIDIPSQHTSITIKIIDKERSTLRRKLFRYYVGDVTDNRYIETFDRALTLNMLQPGKAYDVYVSCNTVEGSWTIPTKVITLNVLTPWWRSWWAISIYIIVLSFSFFAVWQYQNNKKKMQLARKLEEYRRATLKKEVDFLVNINHELRTPLTLIYAPLKLLINRLKESPRRQISVDELSSIYRHTKKMRDVINMSLDLWHVEGSHQEANLSSHDFNEWVHAIGDSFDNAIELKQMNILYSLDPSIGQITFDKSRVDIMLSHILMTAIKHAPPRSQLEVFTQHIDNHAKVIVKNYGQPLSQEELESAFSRHNNSDFSQGLGLAHTKSIIELHNGHIGVFNNDTGIGMSIWFDLPLTLQSNENATSSIDITDVDKSTDNNDFNTSHLSALVVVDDTELCMFITSQLREHFHKVLYAFNGKDALLMVRQNHPDILISDASLSGLSGVELCKTIKSDTDLLLMPVILLTSSTEGSNIDNDIALNADSYIPKPFDMTQLIGKCRNLLFRRSIMKKRYKDNALNISLDENAENNANEIFLQKINDIIASSIASEDFNVDIIVNRMHMSRSALYAKFKELTGHSIGNYIAEYRLSRAKALLARKELSINEISEQLGFRSQRYFATFFKDKTGMTPSAYRGSVNSTSTDNSNESD